MSMLKLFDTLVRSRSWQNNPRTVTYEDVEYCTTVERTRTHIEVEIEYEVAEN